MNSIPTELFSRAQELKLRLDVNTEFSQPIAVLYKPTPRSKVFLEKRVWGYRFKTIDSLSTAVDNYLSAIEKAEQQKIEERKIRTGRRKAFADSVREGDIFVASWGWEQTNVQAFQVVERKNQTVKLREINIVSVSDTSWASDKVRPSKDSFINDEIITKRLGDGFIKFSSFMTALPDDGREYHRSWYA